MQQFDNFILLIYKLQCGPILYTDGASNVGYITDTGELNDGDGEYILVTRKEVGGGKPSIGDFCCPFSLCSYVLDSYQGNVRPHWTSLV